MKSRGRRYSYGLLAVVIGAISGSPSAHADAVQDGEAGLKALAAGHYDDAIRLFSSAIKAKDLSNDDREFAYVSRSKAYIGKHDTADALSDLHQALRLNPGDTEAEALLADASTPKPETPPPAETADAAEVTSPQGHWGLFGEMAGRYYWYQISGAAPFIAVYHLEWTKPDQLLSTTLRSKTQLVQVGEYQFDEAAGELLSASLTGGVAAYGTTVLSGASVVEYSYANGNAFREILTRQADGSINQVEQKYTAGAWHDGDQVKFVEVSREALEAQGFLKRRK